MGGLRERVQGHVLTLLGLLLALVRQRGNIKRLPQLGLLDRPGESLVAFIPASRLLGLLLRFSLHLDDLQEVGARPAARLTADLHDLGDGVAAFQKNGCHSSILCGLTAAHRPRVPLA